MRQIYSNRLKKFYKLLLVTKLIEYLLLLAFNQTNQKRLPVNLGAAKRGKKTFVN